MSQASAASITAIQRAYIAYYGRPADFAGLQYWAGVLDAAKGNLGAIIGSFGNSEESKALYGDGSVGERLEKIYLQIFNRPIDAGGKQYWSEQIGSGTHSLQTAALAILEGAEDGDDGAADATLVARKLAAAEQFTAALHAQKMGHWYNDKSIDAARDYLSAVGAGSSDGQIGQLLDSTLEGLLNATWVHYNSASNTGLGTLGSSAGFDGFDGGVLFGGSGWTNNFSDRDVFLASIDSSLQPGIAARIGHSNFNETLHGLTASTDGGFIVWGDLDSSSAAATANLQFVWKLDANLRPLAEARIGTSSGNAPEIAKVLSLKNGKTLVVGRENNVGDSWDAFAVVLNEDLSVYAQKRFDSPSRVGSSENFRDAIELDNGELILMGSGGELFRVDQGLNLQGLTRDFDRTQVKQLKGELLLVYSSNAYLVVDHEFNIKGSFLFNGADRLEEKAPGEFIAYKNGGIFFELEIDVSNPASPLLNIDHGKQIVTRNGNGSSVNDFSVDDGVITAVRNNDLFVFRPDMEANPNLGADFRLYDYEVRNDARAYNYNAVVRPDWEVADLQIVTVGTTPGYSTEQDLIRDADFSAI